MTFKSLIKCCELNFFYDTELAWLGCFLKMLVLAIFNLYLKGKYFNNSHLLGRLPHKLCVLCMCLARLIQFLHCKSSEYMATIRICQNINFVSCIAFQDSFEYSEHHGSYSYINMPSKYNLNR